MEGLTPNTQYFYKAGSNGGDWSDEFTFATPPLPVDQQNTRFVFAVVADMGTTIPMGWAVTDQMVGDNQEDPFSLVVHAGTRCIRFDAWR